MAIFRLTAMLAAACLFMGAVPAYAFNFGSGVAKSETRTPGNFSKIEISGSMIVEVTAGQPSTSVTVIGDDNLVPEVETSVSGDVLRITFYQGYASNKSVTVKITAPVLSSISAWGAAKITATGLSGERFYLEGNGATNAALNGKAGTLAIRLLGAGRVDAFGLESRIADVSFIGAGSAEVNASEKLDVWIVGAGKVVHTAQPGAAVTRTIVGAGKVEVRK